MFLSRRALLLGGLSVGALGASFGVSTLLPANGCRVLSSQEHEIVQAIAQAMFPKTDDLAGADELDIAGEVDRILADVLDDPAVIGFLELCCAHSSGEATRAVLDVFHDLKFGNAERFWMSGALLVCCRG